MGPLRRNDENYGLVYTAKNESGQSGPRISNLKQDRRNLLESKMGTAAKEGSYGSEILQNDTHYGHNSFLVLSLLEPACVFTAHNFSQRNELSGEALEGFPHTEFESTSAYGGSIMYRFPSGFALELLVEKYGMDLTEFGDNFGTLHMQPVLLLFKAQRMPSNGTGGSGHAEVGLGINFTSFDKGPFITNAENTYGVQYTIDTDDSFVFELGAGLDYFFTSHFSFAFDFRLFLGNVGTTWTVSGPGGTLPVEDVSKFLTNNVQLLAGLRLWF